MFPFPDYPSNRNGKTFIFATNVLEFKHDPNCTSCKRSRICKVALRHSFSMSKRELLETTVTKVSNQVCIIGKEVLGDNERKGRSVSIIHEHLE